MFKEFITPPQTFVGYQILTQALQQCQLTKSKILIVSDQSMIKFGYIDLLTAYFKQNNIAFHLYAEVNSEPNIEHVENGYRLFLEYQCDTLLAIGGGSPLDTMKAIALMLSSNGQLVSSAIVQTLPKMIAIPTTAGTGSEATQFTIITNNQTKVKMLLKSPKLIPNIAIIDAFFTMTTPKNITANCGIDALCHALEAFISIKKQELSNLYAISAISDIFEALPICFSDSNNMIMRQKMALASYKAGVAFNNSSVTLIHGMSRPIGANFHLPHGLSNAILLKLCLKQFRQNCPLELAQLAQALNFVQDVSIDEAADIFVKQCNDLLAFLQIPAATDLINTQAIDDELLDKMSYDAIASGSPANCPFEINQQQIKLLYQQLFEN